MCKAEGDVEKKLETTVGSGVKAYHNGLLDLKGTLIYP